MKMPYRQHDWFDFNTVVSSLSTRIVKKLHPSVTDPLKPCLVFYISIPSDETRRIVCVSTRWIVFASPVTFYYNNFIFKASVFRCSYLLKR